MHAQLRLASVSGGGTSLSSPMFAGIQALIDQGLSNMGLSPDLGNAAPTLYELAATDPGRPALAGCNADKGTKGTSGCVFHSITDRGNSTQCVDVEEFEETAPGCDYCGTIQNLEGIYGPTLVGLTSTDASKRYDVKTAAFAAHAGWNFANGLGSVNANNLFAARKKFVNP